MAIPKMSSKELNMIMTETQNTLESMETNIKRVQEDLEKKIMILHNNSEYTSKMARGIEEKIKSYPEGEAIKGLNNRNVFSGENDLAGLYEKYGSTVHSAFVRDPINSLNAYTGRDWIYRPTAEVKINGVVKSKNQYILMHDQVKGKGLAFEEYDTPDLKIEVVVDRGLIMGPMEFNVLEISPFLSGSFSLSNIKIYDLHPSEEGSPDLEIEVVPEVGAQRIILDKKYSLLKLEMDVRLHFVNGEGKYPFGLKHLYFLNADFKSDSHVIVKQEHTGFINTIGETVFLKDVYSRRAVKASDEDIRFYLELIENKPEYEIATSSYPGEWPLIKNTRHFFTFIPLKGRALQSLEIKDIITR